jgi:tetratricopeptide (TPR) repeat protein
MPRQQTDHLLQLIKSMTKGEKRSFRLWVNRDGPSEDKIFMQLFDVLDKQEDYDEGLIFKKIPRLKKSQLSNIKANLYRQLLISLRNLYKKTDNDIAIRENIDYAKVLYNRGLYNQSLDMLEKAKKTALQSQQYTLTLSVIELERHIESQHITGSMSEKAEEIKSLSLDIIKKVVVNNELANFSLMLYGFYLRYGYVKDKKDYRFVKEYFDAHHPNVEVAELDFYEKLLLYQCYVWYYNMIQDFANYYRYARSWVELFHQDEAKKYTDTTIYFKGLHNELNALFMAQRHDRFLSAFEELLSIKGDKKLINNRNKESIWTLFSYLHGINLIYLTADYQEGTKYVKPLEKILESNKYNWDLNRLIVFYYKIACIYFGADDWEKAIFYLNKITNNYYPDFRGDIQCFARILNLIAHFELGNDILVSYQVKSIYRFLAKMEDLGDVQREIFSFIKRTPTMHESGLLDEFKALKKRLLILKDDPYERRPFLYLDIISWLDAKIKGIRMQEAIKLSKGLELEG